MPNTNEDRDGLVVYRGDVVHQTDPDTGKTLRRGIVTGDPQDGRCWVRWAQASYDVAVVCAQICVVPS